MPNDAQIVDCLQRCLSAVADARSALSNEIGPYTQRSSIDATCLAKIDACLETLKRIGADADKVDGVQELLTAYERYALAPNPACREASWRRLESARYRLRELVVTAAPQDDTATERGGAESATAANLGEANQPLATFISYSHKDEAHRERLETHLALLKRQGVLGIWHDRKIKPGEQLDKIIGRKLEEADIILLLVSADFLASDPCYEKEMQRAIERHEAGRASVMPIIVEACQWKKAPFGELLALPEDGKAVATWDNQDVAWSDVAAGIERTANAIKERKGG